MTKRKFYRSTVVVTVLHEEEGLLNQMTELGEIADLIEAGDCSGAWSVKKEETLNGKQIAKALLEQKSDPEFFRITEEGNDVES